MNVEGLNPLQMVTSTNNVEVNKSVQQTNTVDFKGVLKNALNDVNLKQIQSDQNTARLVAGENVDLHNVMISAQKASISLQATIEVRNKVVEAYQEIMRMQV